MNGLPGTVLVRIIAALLHGLPLIPYDFWILTE